jgi:hypothetical protein
MKKLQHLLELFRSRTMRIAAQNLERPNVMREAECRLFHARPQGWQLLLSPAEAG